MKQSRFVIAFLLFFVSIAFVRCSKDQIKTLTAKELIVQGQWNVSYYYDGQDNTAQFHDYNFSFSNNGSVTATNGSGSVSGTWSTSNDALSIDFSNQDAHLAELNTSWSFGSVTPASIGLKNASNTQLVLGR